MKHELCCFFVCQKIWTYLRERQGALLRPCLPAKWGRDLSDDGGSRPSFVQHWSDSRFDKRGTKHDPGCRTIDEEIARLRQWEKQLAERGQLVTSTAQDDSEKFEGSSPSGEAQQQHIAKALAREF